MTNYLMIDGKKIKLSKETVNELKEKFKEPKRIPCPIKMYIFNGTSGIPFNNNKQLLYSVNGIYYVSRGFTEFLVDCDLIPCDRDDLKPDDLAFRTDVIEADEDFNIIHGYCVILDNTKYAYIDGDGGTKRTYNKWGYWYKVVRREG